MKRQHISLIDQIKNEELKKEKARKEILKRWQLKGRINGFRGTSGLKFHHSIVGNDVYCQCYTSEQIYHIKNIDNGHYHNRDNMATRYHEDNARPHSKSDNRFKSGRHTKFGAKLKKEIGAERFEKLEQLALSGEKYNIQFFEEMADKYRKKYKALATRLGCDPWKV